MSDFGRELAQSCQDALDYVDGKLACRVAVYVRPREVRKACGLEPPEMAERLGMDLGGYLVWEGRMFRVRDEVTFRKPWYVESPWEQLAELVEAVQAERQGA